MVVRSGWECLDAGVEGLDGGGEAAAVVSDTDSIGRLYGRVKWRVCRVRMIVNVAS
jgi:hypothetical protein